MGFDIFAELTGTSADTAGDRATEDVMLEAALKLPCFNRLSISDSVVRNLSISSCLSEICLTSHSRTSAARLTSSSEKLDICKASLT
jgi:hypothetical protein